MFSVILNSRIIIVLAHSAWGSVYLILIWTFVLLILRTWKGDADRKGTLTPDGDLYHRVRRWGESVPLQCLAWPQWAAEERECHQPLSDVNFVYLLFNCLSSWISVAVSSLTRAATILEWKQALPFQCDWKEAQAKHFCSRDTVLPNSWWSLVSEV